MGFTEVSLNRVNEFYMTDDDKLTAAMRAGRIDSVEKLRHFPDLDAALIRFIIGPIDTNTVINEYIPIDASVCENNNCPTLKRIQSITDLPDVLKDISDDDPDSLYSEQSMIESCRMECAKCPYNNVHCKKSYINPKQRYKLYNKLRNRISRPNLRFTKVHIKLMLLFQSWPAELVQKSGIYDGILPDVYVPDLATILGCNADYLEDCIKDIGNMSLLDLEWLSPHTYNISIPDYYLKFKKASEGGAGYIQIDRTMLISLLQEKNIITLRGKLFQLLVNPVSDDSKADKPKVITLNEFKAVMPKYVNYQAQYEKALKNDLFSMKYDKRLKKIFYKPKIELETVAKKKNDIMMKNIRMLGLTLKKSMPTFVTEANTTSLDNVSYKSTINKILEQSHEHIPAAVLAKKPLVSFLKDALQISVEYGIANVSKAIYQLERAYLLSGTQIKNAGAILRTQCCFNMVNGLT
jgi:hypothetical protein